ncbi:MAG TPA: acyl-CoA dehydrogenase family protein [Mycobacteriales bacterium]|nr:acyl-CoA dehydrogenase family protein [Mycobacteriales bacterium]
MRRRIFTEEHDAFRAMVRTFIADEVVPVYADWEAAGHAPRSFARRLGDLGITGLAVPEAYGGAGVNSYRFSAILSEEFARALVGPGSLRTHMDIVMPYFLAYASEEQRERWFPRLASGEMLTAIAMTEPGTGSDLAGITTRADRDGDGYVLNGAKTFITGGIIADAVIVVARTGDDAADRRRGLTLLVVEDGMPGFRKGRNLPKLGLRPQDTAELTFDDVRVPATNRLGEEGHAFTYLGNNLPKERLSIAVAAVAAAQAALRITVDYVKDRKAFGQPVSSFQNTKFELASVATELEAAQCLVDRAIEDLDDGLLTPVDAAKAKLFCTELQSRVVDRCLQLFGGYGYMLEMPISRLYADARVTRIYGGTSEVMRTIIGKSLGL